MHTQTKSVYFYTLFLLSLILALLMSSSAWAAQTVHIILEIDGNRIEGESTIQSMDREGTIEAYSAGLSVITPRDSGTGQQTGARLYRPFTVLKPVDKSTPHLFQALAQNRPVTRLEARYYRPDRTGAGSEEHYYTVLMENGYVSSIVQTSETGLASGIANAAPATELVSFGFQRITFIYEIGGVEFQDDLSR